MKIKKLYLISKEKLRGYKNKTAFLIELK